MVTLQLGYYFGHTFDLGVRLDLDKAWLTRDSVPTPPIALRFRLLEVEDCIVCINQLGFAAVLQPMPGVSSPSEADDRYNLGFDGPYAHVCSLLRQVFGSRPIGDTSFVVEVGAPSLMVGWRLVQLPSHGVFASVFFEALMIDELCRALERRSQSFMNESTLPEDRYLVQYAECLFPLSEPAHFLVDEFEIEQMSQFYSNWNLGKRVSSLRQRLAESVTNTALYRGHLERNRQGALNALLTSVALVSLAGVSASLERVFTSMSVPISGVQFDQIFAGGALVVLLAGVLTYIVKPKVLILLDDVKSMRLSRSVAQYLSARSRRG